MIEGCPAPVNVLDGLSAAWIGLDYGGGVPAEGRCGRPVSCVAILEKKVEPGGGRVEETVVPEGELPGPGMVGSDADDADGLSMGLVLDPLEPEPRLLANPIGVSLRNPGHLGRNWRPVEGPGWPKKGPGSSGSGRGLVCRRGADGTRCLNVVNTFGLYLLGLFWFKICPSHTLAMFSAPT
jgi:hypothetical protein